MHEFVFGHHSVRRILFDAVCYTLLETMIYRLIFALLCESLMIQ